MSKLIGTGINQVPSNADLGSAAFKEEKDFLSAKGSSLSAINAVIDNDPAGRVVFIYDTTLDSDNGEWRKRTHNTSWYNEELNTATRGSRREFPCVALMVLTDTGANTKLTIYDADDPDLPMWMVFRQASGYYINTNGYTLQDVAALNGKGAPIPAYTNTCYSVVAPNDAFSVAAVYQLAADKHKVMKVAGGLTPSGDKRNAAHREREVQYALSWYENITTDAFSDGKKLPL